MPSSAAVGRVRHQQSRSRMASGTGSFGSGRVDPGPDDRLRRQRNAVQRLAARTDGDVQPAAADRLRIARRAARRGDDLDLRIAQRESRQRPLEDRIVEIVGNADPDTAGKCAVEQAGRALELGERPARRRQSSFSPLAVSTMPRALPVEQRGVEGLLQLAQLHADRRLGFVQLLGGARQIPAFGDGNEGLQQVAAGQLTFDFDHANHHNNSIYRRQRRRANLR